MKDAVLLHSQEVAQEAVKTGGTAVKQRARFGIKLAIGAALLAWLIFRSGWHKIAACLTAVSPGWLLLALVTYLIGQSLCAWKWRVLARSLGFERSFRFYWVNYLGAMFPSLFLPTSVGGDVFRAMALCRGGGSKRDATLTVLADRGTGVLAMSWIAALACALLHPPHLPVLASDAIYVLCGALTLGFILPFFVRPAFTRRGFAARMLACWDRPADLVISLAAAAVFQALLCVIYVLLGQALALPVQPGFYFLICPIVSLASMAPMTVNGVGVREATLTALLPMAGISGEQAVTFGVSFGLAWSAMVTLASLLGGGLLFAEERSAGWSPDVDKPMGEL